MRRVKHLITQVRNETENVQLGITDGITDEEIIQFLNNGQEDLYTSIIEVHNRAFTEVGLVDVVRGQDTYDLPSDMYQYHRIISAWYSETGNPRDYRRLSRITLAEKVDTEGRPGRYALKGSQEFLLDPVPSKSVTNGVRFFYDPHKPRMDKRRTTVSSVTGTTTITALTLDSGSSLFTQGDYDNDDFLTFVDRDGVQQAKAFPYDSVSAGGVVTIPGGSFTLGAGESITAGDFVCLGENHSTHSSLPDSNERYLIAYAAWRMFRRDSSTDAMEAKADLDQMKQGIVSNYADENGDPDEVPITDMTYFPEEDLF